MRSQLHHLALGAQDVASLADFYRDAVGLVEVARNLEPDGAALRSVWFDLGGGGILMIEKAEEAPRPVIGGHGAGLFLLAVTADEETVEKRCKALESMGIRQERSTEFTRYFRDPEGNRFAFSVYSLDE